MSSRICATFFILSLLLVSTGLLQGCGSKPNPDLNLGGMDIEEAFNGQLSRVHQIMGGVKSYDSVDDALTELELVNSNLDDLIFNSAKLSEDGQMALSLLAMKAAPDLEALVSDVNGSPSTREKLGGVMGDILGKVKALI